jgi:hypothetical protein
LVNKASKLCMCLISPCSFIFNIIMNNDAMNDFENKKMQLERLE